MPYTFFYEPQRHKAHKEALFKNSFVTFVSLWWEICSSLQNLVFLQIVDDG